ncbi:MAG: methyl-accepting chemotaxis protein [Pseudomonadota bacterium]|jgi:PAS domain S-box-containing protein
MRINMPVTNVERELKDGTTIVSETDLKGRITSANRDFIEISGFSEEELIGAPQNIVRHPDMPPEAFADFWATLKSNRPWTGLVKNRCKSGDYYWVLATATPIRKDGQVVGYLSVRTKPSREQVEEAGRVYRLFREGKAGHLMIRQGKVIPRNRFGRFNPTIKARLVFVIAFLSLLLAAMGALGLYGMNRAVGGLETVYQDRTIPLQQLAAISGLTAGSRLAIEQAILHPTQENITAGAERVGQNLAAMNKTWAEYMATYLTEDEKKLAKKFSDDRDQLISQGLTPAVAALRGGKVEEAKGIDAEKILPLYKTVQQDLDDLNALQVAVARDEYNAAVSGYAFVRNLALFVVVAGILLAVLAAVALIRAVVRPLQDAVGVVNAVASGDLGSNIEVESKDEIGQLMQALEDMNRNLVGLVGSVRTSTEAITAGTGQIAAGNADLSSRTEAQASSLEETASSMEELTSTVRQNAENAQQATQLAKSASDVAKQGGTAVRQVVETMGSINESSRKIADIISVIDGIAFQTNILALNAAVEAARAGEQGRGFAVVAGEVRALAQRSAAAAKEIKGLISDSVQTVEAGTDLVGKAGKTMEEIVGSVQRVTDLMAEISAATAEQSAGIDQINQAVTQLDQVTQQNGGLVEEVATASEIMAEQAKILAGSVSVFVLGAASAR